MNQAIVSAQDQKAMAVLAHWQEYADVGTSSQKTYDAALKSWFAFLAEKDLDFQKVTRADVKTYLNEFCAGLAQSTKELRLQVIKTFYNFAGVKNPADHLKIKKAQAKNFNKDFLTKENAARLIQSVENKRDKAMLLLMICAGLRVCEIAAADVTDFATLPDGQRVLYVLGKARAAKTEFVKVPALVWQAIVDYLDGRKSGALFEGDANRNQGKRLARRTVSYIAKKALRGIGFDSKRFSAHSLRHTAAVLNLQAGGTLTETMQMLRHKNIATTQIYTHAVERLQNKSEARIADFVFGG